MRHLIGIVMFIASALMPAAGGDVRVYIDGGAVHFADQPPVIVDGRTLVPVRGVFEHMGFDVDWCTIDGVAWLFRGDDIVMIPADAGFFAVDGRLIFPDVPQQIMGDRLMLPLRAVSEALGADVYWDAAVAIVRITTNGAQVYSYQQTRLQKSGQILPPRPLISAELTAWRDYYHSFGGPCAFELEIIRLTNIAREQAGAPPLRLSPPLMMAARFKAQEMANLGYFQTISPIYGEMGIFGMFAMGGGFAINVATGDSPADVVNAWMDAPHIRAALLYPGHREIGVGEYGGRWAQIMAQNTTPAAQIINPDAQIPTSPPPVTRSAMVLPNRRLTDAEMAAWQAEYRLWGINAMEHEIIRLTNIERAAAGLNELVPNPNLMMAARFKAQSIADLDYLAHTGVYGTPTALARTFGFAGGVSENLARGQGSPEAAIEAWLDSPGHARNMMNRMYHSIGVGVYADANGRLGWVQMFSSVRPAPQADLTPVEPISPGNGLRGFYIGGQFGPTAEFRASRRTLQDGASTWHFFPTGQNIFDNFTIVRTEGNIIRFVYTIDAGRREYLGEFGHTSESVYLDIMNELLRSHLNAMGRNTADRRTPAANQVALGYLTQTAATPLLDINFTLANLISNPQVLHMLIIQSSGNATADMAQIVRDYREAIEAAASAGVGFAIYQGRIGFVVMR